MNKRAWQCLIALGLTLSPPGPAPADEATPANVSAESAAPLIVNQQTITVFRSSFLGLTPSERAEGARSRIKQYVQEYGYGSIATEPTPHGAAVLIHGDIMFVVTPGDIGQIPGANLQSSAEAAARSLARLETWERLEKLKHKLASVRITPKKLLIAMGLLVGTFGIAFIGARAIRLRANTTTARCPKCENTNEELIRFIEEPASFRVMRKYYCDACGYKWLKKG